MITLGINFYGQPSSASIVKDGKLKFAIEEERLSRIKQDGNFPIKSIKACLKFLNITIKDVDAIGVATIPNRIIKERYLKYTLDNFPKSNSLIISDRAFGRLKYLNGIEDQIRKSLKFKKKIYFYHHHLCHLASSHYLSGFQNSCSVSMDGLGEIESSTIGISTGKKVKIIDRIDFPHSIGIVYKALTDYLGFDHRTGQGTVMALAALGNYKKKVKKNNYNYYDIFKRIILIDKNGKFTIDKSYFNYPYKLEGWVSEKFINIFGPQRNKNTKINDHYKNIASALQKRFEDAYIAYVKLAKKLTKLENLTLSGGCVLNCKANGEIAKLNLFKNIYTQPACGDNGLCIAAAYFASQKVDRKGFNKDLNYEKFSHTYLGPSYNDAQILRAIKKSKYKFLHSSNISEIASEYLSNGKVIGWFQGRMEFGPRALGNRSILSAPFPISKKKYLNSKVKHRENFRPFAPSVLEDQIDKYFNLKYESPFMLIAIKSTKKLKKIAPAIIHLDDTARIQTVNSKQNLKYHSLITDFSKKTGCPILLNTSFNDKGEPIVCSPSDAIKSFDKTNLDVLVLGDYYYERKK